MSRRSYFQQIAGEGSSPMRLAPPRLLFRPEPMPLEAISDIEPTNRPRPETRIPAVPEQPASTSDAAPSAGASASSRAPVQAARPMVLDGIEFLVPPIRTPAALDTRPTTPPAAPASNIARDQTRQSQSSSSRELKRKQSAIDSTRQAPLQEEAKGERQPEVLSSSREQARQEKPWPGLRKC